VTEPIETGKPTDLSTDSLGPRPLLEIGEGNAREARDAMTLLVAELQAGLDCDEADTYDSRFAADILWGSPFGATVRGYEPLHAIHVRMHQRPGGGPAGPSSRFEVVHVLVPSPDVAIAQVRRVALDGAGHAVEPTFDTTKPFSEMALYVLVRRDGTWWLAAGQNTPVRPGAPSSH
jgi:uncharacterized protein (TIGR02246 family)